MMVWEQNIEFEEEYDWLCERKQELMREFLSVSKAIEEYEEEVTS